MRLLSILIFSFFNVLASLGILLFGTMVSASFKISTQAEKKIQAFYEGETKAERQEPGDKYLDSTVSPDISPKGFIASDDLKNLSVQLYGNAEIQAYKK